MSDARGRGGRRWVLAAVLVGVGGWFARSRLAAPPAPAQRAPAVTAEPDREPVARAREVPAEPAVDDAPYGPGSKPAMPDGASPSPEYTIKGKVSSMLVHPPSSPYYTRTRAEVWFRSGADALAAGFTECQPRKRS